MRKIFYDICLLHNVIDHLSLNVIHLMESSFIGQATLFAGYLASQNNKSICLLINPNLYYLYLKNFRNGKKA